MAKHANESHQSEMLDILNARLAKRLEAEQAPEPARREPKAKELPSILDVVNEAIAALPGTDAEWSVIQRYGASEVKERIFQAREKVCLLRDLLLQS